MVLRVWNDMRWVINYWILIWVNYPFKLAEMNNVIVARLHPPCTHINQTIWLHHYAFDPENSDNMLHAFKLYSSVEHKKIRYFEDCFLIWWRPAFFKICSFVLTEDRKSYRFRMTWGFVKTRRISIFVWTIPLILVFLILEKWLHLVWLHHEKEYCALNGISNIHSAVFNLPELWSGKATRQSWHSRALSCRLLVSNLGAAVGLC